MQAHQERQSHPDEHREQGQAQVLNANYFVIDAEDIFPDETGRGLMLRMTAAVFVRYHQSTPRNRSSRRFSLPGKIIFILAGSKSPTRHSPAKAARRAGSLRYGDGA
jgi:hypothetical protein